MAYERRLIVNADDLGLSPGINGGIFAAHENGIVTSASLMVRWNAAEEAANYARHSTSLSVGLHIDTGEWFFRNNEWVALYEVVQGEEPGALDAEVKRQLACFRELMGREPSHIDSHQHVHRHQPLASIALSLSRELRVPLRHRSNEIAHNGRFYGQMGDGTPLPAEITPESLIRLFGELPIGTTELGCHPGLGDDIESMYRSERAIEVATLCDPCVRAAIVSEGITLTNFAELTSRQSSNVSSQTQ